MLSHVLFIDAITGDEYNLININRFLDPENAVDRAMIEEFKTTEKYKEDIAKSDVDDQKRLTVNVCYPRGAKASLDPLLNGFWTGFEDDEEQINLLDI